MRKLLYLFGLFICMTAFSEEQLSSKLLSFENEDSVNVVYDFLQSLDLLYTSKSFKSKINCEKQITRPNQAVISNDVISHFKLSNSPVENGETYIANFLQQLKKSDSRKGNIVTSLPGFCDAEVSNNGEEIQRVTAQVEITNELTKTTTNLLFALVKDARDDIRANPFKILYIKEEGCTEEEISLCAGSIKEATSLMEAFQFEEALQLVDGLENCKPVNQKAVTDLLQQCRFELAQIRIQDSLEVLALRQAEEAIDIAAQNEEEKKRLNQKYRSQGDSFFAQGEFEKARQQYLLISEEEVEDKLTQCKNCIKAKKVMAQGDTFFESDRKISAYNTYSMADQICPSFGANAKVIQVRQLICNAYIEDAEALLENSDYLGALTIVRQVFDFEPTNVSAKEIEKRCMEYNQPDFIRGEIAKAKKLFYKNKPSKKKNARKEKAEVLRVFHRYRNSKHMDGESFALLAFMQLRPGMYGLDKEFDKDNLKDFKTYWKVDFKRATAKCKEDGGCDKDVNYMLEIINEEFYKK